MQTFAVVGGLRNLFLLACGKCLFPLSFLLSFFHSVFYIKLLVYL